MPQTVSRLLLAILLAASLADTAAAQTDPDAQAAGRVVLQQLDAFRRDDFDTAFSFASNTIHQLFDRARFEQMVRTGYPEIAKSVSANVDGSRRGDSGEIYLFVRVQGANGRTIEAVYEMINEAGTWRINAVVARPDTSEKA